MAFCFGREGYQQVKMGGMDTDHKTLLDIFAAGLDAVKGDNAVYQALMVQGTQPACHVVAIGKAAEAMYDGVCRYLGKDVKSALLISKYGHFSPEILSARHVRALEAAHPVPAASSLQAGQALLGYVQALPADEPVLFLISGGASSLCEVLDEGWTLERLQAVTQERLADGSSIHEINAMRRQVSRIKGGKLWAFLGKRPVRCLLISDVPDDDPRVIGSGLLFPAPADDFVWQVVASNRQMLVAMAAQSVQLMPTSPVTVMPAFLQGDAVLAAQSCVNHLRNSPPGVYLWGAETTVCLPENPGRGGRNQHFALAAALQFQPDDRICLLAVGSDGTDGVTDDAGAWVDHGTLGRGRLANLDPVDCLHRADAGTFLDASGDLIYTGPTGTNVMDVVIGLRY